MIERDKYAEMMIDPQNEDLNKPIVDIIREVAEEEGLEEEEVKEIWEAFEKEARGYIEQKQKPKVKTDKKKKKSKRKQAKQSRKRNR